MTAHRPWWRTRRWWWRRRRRSDRYRGPLLDARFASQWRNLSFAGTRSRPTWKQTKSEVFRGLSTVPELAHGRPESRPGQWCLWVCPLCSGTRSRPTWKQTKSVVFGGVSTVCRNSLTADLEAEQVSGVQGYAHCVREQPSQMQNRSLVFRVRTVSKFHFIPIPLSLSSSPRAHLHVVAMLWFMSKDINQPSLPTLFYSVFVSISVFMALSTILLLPYSSYWSFQLYISLWKSLSALI